MGTLIDLTDHFAALRRVNAEAEERMDTPWWMMLVGTALVAVGAPHVAAAVDEWRMRRRAR